MTVNNLYFYLLGITLCFVSSTVGDEAVIHGQNAGDHQFPYQVAIFTEAGGIQCGGGIIGERFILTAAHCVINPTNEFEKSRLTVLVGSNNLRKTSEPAMILDVERMFVPKIFDAFTKTVEGDIAVLELAKGLELSANRRYLKKLILPKNRKESYDGLTAEIAGYGWNWIKLGETKDTGNNTDGYLRYVEAEVLNENYCRELMTPTTILDKDLCAKVKQSANKLHGVCNGDSGGPLVVNGSIVIGIFSRGPRICEESVRSGIYTRVSHYLTFIHNVMNGKSNRNMRIHVYNKNE